ncbi:MFS transporter [Intrasporangium sp.]|uniref:MFS transporter n=1 Tax=Intrasporangium sp. TaxID=1925024 RepID=UPI00293B5F0D|nr:MFS transporter [Intrasporangium sp.]MDV3223234.1 MFS transporter [Intrasporangium sp.]
MQSVTQVRAEETRAWSSRAFRWFWTGSAVSMLGSEVAELALPLLALVTFSAGADQLAILRTAQFLPFLLAALPVGLLVDRRRRRGLMIGSDIGRFVLIAIIPVSIWVGLAGMELLYAVVFAAGICTVIHQLAHFAFVPSVVSAGQLTDANAKITATQSAAEISGRGVGGLLVQALGAPAAVTVNAATHLLSALSLSRVRVDEPPPPTTPRAPLREAIEGIRVAVGNRYLRALLGEATTFNLFNEVFMLGLMIYAVRDLGISAAGIGAVFVAGGLGSFLGAWFGTRVTGRWGYGRVLLATLVAGNTAPVGAVAVAPGSPGAAGVLLGSLFFIMGVGIGIANSHATTVRQLATEPQLLGRVNSAYRLISWGVLPVGAIAGGAVATQVGPWTAVLAGSVGMATATLWVLFSPVPRLRTVTDAVG